jgi:CcmD family protein
MPTALVTELAPCILAPAALSLFFSVLRIMYKTEKQFLSATGAKSHGLVATYTVVWLGFFVYLAVIILRMRALHAKLSSLEKLAESVEDNVRPG